MVNGIPGSGCHRDRQLKVQLQLRDEYMDVELRRRDQNLENALK